MTNCVNRPSFIWRIENFTSVREMVSPTIFFKDSEWLLKFFQFLEDGYETILLILKCQRTAEILSTVQFKTSVGIVTTSNGQLHLVRDTSFNSKDNERCVWRYTVDSIYKAVGRGKDICISVTMTPIGDLQKLFGLQKCVEEASHEALCAKSLTADIKKLFNDEETSDFVLKCDRRSFHVHKAVLSARSDYFAGMFRSDMKEVNEGAGKIEDLEPDVLELILRYVYSGELPVLPVETIRKVYAGADRFSIECLKVKCCSSFINNVIGDPEENFGKNTEENSNASKQSEDVETEYYTTNSLFTPRRVEAIRFITLAPVKAFNDSEENSIVSEENSIVSEENSIVSEESENVETESLEMDENEILKGLFMSREWKLFYRRFPHKAREICRPYLLQM